MFVRRLFVCVVLMFCCCAVALGQVAGQNINMVSGTVWPAGDPYLQRQNEPSMAVSSRNPEHLLGGANDYRTVDIPNPNAPTILGDAWLGVYSSLDGGETWKSTLLPGYPQDITTIGTSSPLHAFTVATDPTVRAGTNGMFYYSGLVFNRGTGAPSGVFVATFQDQNNKGNGSAAIQTTTNGPGNAFAYIGVSMVDSGTTGQFLDKPWIVVDIPRSGRTATCKGSDGKTFSSGYVYIVYTQFNGSQNNPSSKIKEVTSTNCGATWSHPEILSQSQKVAQGTVAAIDPNNGNVYVAWRQIAVAGNMNQPDAIQYAVSTDGGNSFSYQPPVFTFAAPTKTNAYPPESVFDQPQASGTTFRSLDVPTMAVDANSRVWVAFSERVNGPTTGTYGSRIMITTLPSGASKWTTPYVADSTAPSTAYGHQFMPALNFAYGKLMLAWFDSRRDNLESVLKCQSGTNNCTDLSQLTLTDQPIPGSTLATPATVFTPTISDPNSGVRHTIDVFGGIVNPSGGTTAFKGFQISQYPYYVDDANGQIEQGFFNPPNLPMFVQGTTPFIGDYIDIASQNILPSGNPLIPWKFNLQATDSTGATNAPDFHITWTDNRDVVPPPVVSGSQDWTQYVPPNGGNSQVSTYSGAGAACPTCTTTQPACAQIAVTNADGTIGTSSYSGDRNQNVYTSRITNGLVVRFKENAKSLSSTVPLRSFSLLVKNTVSPLNTTPLDSPSYYRILLGVTSTTQAPSCTVTGGTANLPGTRNCYLDVAVNPKTTLTQAITITSTSATASVNVLVAQMACIPGTTTGSISCANTPSFVGLQALAVINGDASNPSVPNPDFLTSDNDDPDATTPYGALPIASGEEYDPAVDSPPDPTNGIFTPKIGVPAIFTPKIGNVANSAPQIETPTIFTPKITSIFTPKINSIQIANPTIVDTIFTPKIFTPKIFTPKIVSPDIFTPKITDLGDSGSSSGGSLSSGTNPVTDYTWRVSNKGNTSASYDTTEFAKSSGVSCCPAGCGGNSPNQCTVTPTNPAGSSCSICQLVQQKVYQSPVANRDSSNMNPTCDLTVQQQYITVANVPDPAFSAGMIGGGSPANPTTSTLSLSPGEGNRVTLRTMAPPQTGAAVGSFKTVATSFTGNATSLTIATSALPVAVFGQSYGTNLVSLGGFGSTSWSQPVDPANPVAQAAVPVQLVAQGTALGSIALSPLGVISSGMVSGSVITPTTVSDQPGAYLPVNLQVQDSAVTGTGANAVPSPALDVQQLELDINQFKISSVDVQPGQFENELGTAIYMKTGDSVTVAVTVSNQGPVEATMVTPTLAATTTAGGTPPGPQPIISCSGPNTGSSTIAGGSAAVTDVFDFNCMAGSGNGYVTFTANATAQYKNSAGTVNATANTYTVPPTTDTVVSSVGIDNTAPMLTFGASTPSANAAGWYNSPVVIQFSTSDNLSGVQSSAVTSSTATSTGGASGLMTLTTEGNPVAGSMTATDYSRNTSAPVTSLGFKIDRTPPTISGAPDRAANGYNWYNGSVTVTFTCSDPDPTNGPAGQQSGLVTGAGGCTLPITLSGEGLNQSALGTANDVAGNSASTTVKPINIDLTKPTVTAFVASPVVPATGWYNVSTPNVSFTYTAADALSGVATSTPSPVAVIGEGAAVTAPISVTDKAGNLLNTTTPAVPVDRTPPAVAIASPLNNSVYINNQPIAASYGCTDALSGVASCVGTVFSGANFLQTTPGIYSFGVTGMDVAGNLTPVTVAYSTAYYAFAGFQAPLVAGAGSGTPATPPSTPTNSGSFVAGTTIPVLWTLASTATSSLGQPIIDPTTITSLSAYPYGNATCTGGIPTASIPIPLPAPIYTGTNFQSLWNTGTVTPGCYYLLIAFNDLSSYATNVVITTAGTSNALNFASGDTVDGTNSNLPGNAPQTMQAWINPGSTASGTVFSYVDPAKANQGFGLAYVGQHVYLIGESNDVMGSIMIPINQWTHVAVSYDGTNATLYVNGALDQGTSQTATGVNLVAAGGTWRIGDIVGTTAPDQPFVGMIDEVKVWNTARTASQIVSDMTNELCTGQTGLVAYYKFNEGTGGGTNTGVTTLLDVSSSAANGTLNTFNLTGSTSNWVQGDAPVTADDLSIAVSPGTASLSLTGTTVQQFTATGSCTDTAPTLTPIWSLNPTGFATVSSSGLVTATGPGTTTVTAAYADATGNATVVVGP